MSLASDYAQACEALLAFAAWINATFGDAS